MTTEHQSRAQRLDAETPESRNRVVDFLRAAAITVVVLGHWTMVAVDVDGGIQPHGVLDAARWTHPLTWVFQVMPIFFLVGGYSNALSWRSARRRSPADEGWPPRYAQWLRARLRRLCIPLLPLLLGWLAISVIGVAAGVPGEVLQHASRMALVPTWFLAAYLLVIIVAPACLHLWERFGWWSVVGGIALAGAVDAVSISLDSPLVGYPNYLFVWASFHQVGFAWLDGRLSSIRSRLALLACGVAGLALLVGIGPYPVSMITAGGDAISNSSPTRVTMAFLGMMQAGVVLLLERPLSVLLRRPRLWLATVIVNLRIMTWFLWHLTALVGLSFFLIGLGGLGVLPTPLTGIWWATRPLWWLALLLVTGVLVLVFGRFESPRPDDRPTPPVWKPLAAAVLVCASLAAMANLGTVGPDGIHWIWPLLPGAGLVAFGVVSLPRRSAG
ncbi:MAG TPA: acyltransferase [Arachnia sp.]|nr:acyltransferase [Arachnia sp.]HMT86497.1 acyltransferase [Arachnia sp.]